VNYKYVIVFLVAVISFASQSWISSSSNPPVPTFGLSLNTSPMSGDMIFAIITTKADGRRGVQHITPRDFLYMATGVWRHPVNPDRENLFAKNNVFGGVFIDTISGEKTYFCPSFDSLWKIRYNTNPYHFKSVGWAGGNYMPSSRQLIYLYEEYGVYNINTDFFVDTSFWKILRYESLK
jgi:hypothetical protein